MAVIGKQIKNAIMAKIIVEPHVLPYDDGLGAFGLTCLATNNIHPNFSNSTQMILRV
jgi:hypothetical protein